MEESRLLDPAVCWRGVETATADCWAAAPLIAHNTEFKAQQVERLECVRRGATPHWFEETDHRSPAVYGRYAAQPAAVISAENRTTAMALLEALESVEDDDLIDPSRNPWLDGRPLWLQVIVRGFWHPTGHVGEYHMSCTAFPAPRHSPVSRPQQPNTYVLAMLNPDLAAKAASDPDLAGLRQSGALDDLRSP